MAWRAWVAVWALALAGVISAQEPKQNPVEAAVAALQSGDLAGAERILKALPGDAEALGVLGVVLDQEKKYDGAETAYRRALALTPSGASLLNNYGNHLMATGRTQEARAVFLRAGAANPGQSNAWVQLARIAMERHEPAEAWKYLGRAPAALPAAFAPRMQVLYALHRDAEAAEWQARAEKELDDAGMGVALTSVGQYARAADYLERAARRNPEDFEAQYRLGLAAAHAGQWERAREALTVASTRQPENVDALYDLAAMEAQLGREEQALELLARAAQRAPERADVQRLLARTAGDLGYFGDAVAAWTRVTELAPGDDAARRERGFAQTAVGEKAAAGISDLRWYAARHPNDALGHYELGTAEAASEPAQALRELNRALTLQPELAAAHVARGILQYRQGEFAAAREDFAYAVKRDPKNAAFLDRLGETDLALGRSAEALATLRQAAELAPRNAKVLLHLGRALAAEGKSEESAAALARFRELGPDKSTRSHPAGLVDFLSLPAEEQAARYRAGLERTVREQPGNVEAQVRYLRLLVDDGEPERAGQVARTLRELKPSAVLLAEAAEALLGARQYADAAALLAGSDRLPGLALDRALVEFHVAGARAGLRKLEDAPAAERGGDFALARGIMRAAAGEKGAVFTGSGRPGRLDLVRDAASALLGEQRIPEALGLLKAGMVQAPDAPELLLLQAVGRELAAQHTEADAELGALGNRWPEWSEVWKARALIFLRRGRQADAWAAVETAIRYGPQDVSVRTLAIQIAQLRGDFAAVSEQERMRGYILSPKSQNGRQPAEVSGIESLFR